MDMAGMRVSEAVISENGERSAESINGQGNSILFHKKHACG
jgi:hypothetical protein